MGEVVSFERASVHRDADEITREVERGVRDAARDDLPYLMMVTPEDLHNGDRIMIYTYTVGRSQLDHIKDGYEIIAIGGYNLIHAATAQRMINHLSTTNIGPGELCQSEEIGSLFMLVDQKTAMGHIRMSESDLVDATWRSHEWCMNRGESEPEYLFLMEVVSPSCLTFGDVGAYQIEGCLLSDLEEESAS